MPTVLEGIRTTVSTSLVRFLEVPLTEDPDERRLSGKVGGALWLGGGVVVLMTRLLGSPPQQLPLALAVALSALSFVWGALSVWAIDWVDGPPWMNHLTAAGGLIVLCVATYGTGQEYTIGWYFTWLALYGCFFFYERAAVGFMGLCFLAQAAPVLAHLQRSVHDDALVHLVILVVGYLAVGLALIRGRKLLTHLRQSAVREAGRDPVTGLANHRALDRALNQCAADAIQTGAEFALVVIDIDYLKQLQELYGHEGADTALRRIAWGMSELAAGADVLARTGGDEFSWLMPKTTAAGAQERVEAMRTLLGTVEGEFPVRFSAGICDSEVELDPPALTRLAEGALYWSKMRGRDQSQIYDAELMDVLSADERAEMLERSQAMIGLRALARAIDAKDPATQKHSERVAQVAQELARSIGWEESRVLALRDAALVHDVGKIGVDDAVLRKPSLLTPEERVHVQTHAEISGRIVDGVLSPEQVGWIRTHHERADGGGYPLGLSADQIPAGGALLAIADAFDAMTVERAYSGRRTPAEALEVCRAEAGRHFTAEAVEILERWLLSRPEHLVASVTADLPAPTPEPVRVI